MTPENISYYGPIAVLFVIAAWAGARILYLSKTQGVTVLSFLARTKTPAERGLSVIALVLDGYLILRPFILDLDKMVYAFDQAYPLTGVAIMTVGISIMILSQVMMGLSWRIGVPEEKETSQTLVKTGIYRYSRNPIYVGVMLFLVGAAVTVPGPITIGATILTALLLQPIIKREEAFLAEAFGKDYETYCQEVRRWI